MKRAILYWQMGGFMFASIAGTLLHFLFDLTGGNVVAALFSAVNESIWEHLKLLYYPMIVFGIVEFFFWGRAFSSFWCIKLAGIFLGLVLIPIVYYTYTGILGIHADWVNILIFFLAAAVVYWVETRLLQKACTCPIRSAAAVGAILLICTAFTVLTFFPPHIPFFEDPITGTYGF